MPSARRARRTVYADADSAELFHASYRAVRPSPARSRVRSERPPRRASSQTRQPARRARRARTTEERRMLQRIPRRPSRTVTVRLRRARGDGSWPPTSDGAWAVSVRAHEAGRAVPLSRCPTIARSEPRRLTRATNSISARRAGSRRCSTDEAGAVRQQTCVSTSLRRRASSIGVIGLRARNELAASFDWHGDRSRTRSRSRASLGR
jgi:hypothetical protein